MLESIWPIDPLVSANDYTVADFFGQTWTNFAKNGYDSSDTFEKVMICFVEISFGRLFSRDLVEFILHRMGVLD